MPDVTTITLLPSSIPKLNKKDLTMIKYSMLHSLTYIKIFAKRKSFKEINDNF